MPVVSQDNRTTIHVHPTASDASDPQRVARAVAEEIRRMDTERRRLIEDVVTTDPTGEGVY